MTASTLFLPFTPHGKTTELTAIAVKKKLGVAPYASLDPFIALERVPGHVLDSDTLMRLPQPIRAGLQSDEVSAIGYGVLPSGEWLIYVNPTQHVHRQKVSLMEEIVHITLGHPPTQLTLDPTGKVKFKRPFNSEVEDEAFCVGAACVIPYKPLFNAIKYDRLRVADLSSRYGVSEECVRYRIKRAGLARVYGPLTT